MFAGFSHPSAINVAEKLAQLLPGDLNRVFFSDNGSTAVEVSIKLAYQYWKNQGYEEKTHFLAFEGAYHGDTIGAMSVGQGCGFFSVYKDLMFSIDMLPYAETWQGDQNIEEKEHQALQLIEQTIKKKKNKIAALIVEPLMQGAGGIRLCRPEFMRQVAAIAQDNDILVIFDEVAVGFGRTGSIFACQKIGCTPDLICLSKGLTAGYLPMSVTVASDRIYDVFLSDSFKTAFLHGHSFTANPLACAVALKSLDLFEEENTLEKVANIEAQHLEFLNTLQNYANLKKQRVMGSILAFNLSDEGVYKSEQGEFLRDYFLNNGLNIRPLGTVVYLMPPYCISKNQLKRAYEGILAGLESASRLCR